MTFLANPRGSQGGKDGEDDGHAEVTTPEHFDPGQTVEVDHGNEAGNRSDEAVDT